ncbi:MAG: ABC transporter substrate-binding protein [Candidatus Jidaibacter sp.]|jgi:phospholipid transport system substrate-binding protein|nr:ABC transporter substrate-binding protein [Candidatus Jidaibacter sp.]
MFRYIQTCLFFAMLTFASSSYGYANNSQGAKDFVNSTASRVEGLLKQPIADSDKETKLRAIFADVADIDWIGKFVLGKYWQNLNDQQKVRYLQQYRKYLFASYVPLFRDYNGQKFDIRGSKDLNVDQYLVSTEIKPVDENSSPYKVEYRLKYDSGSFKMRDIIAEGVSMISTQRSEFASIMNNGGFESLIKKLQEKS